MLYHLLEMVEKAAAAVSNTFLKLFGQVPFVYTQWFEVVCK